MSAHWLLDFFDRKKPLYVFFQYGAKTGIKLRDRYSKLCCPDCGKFDTLKALRNGIAPDVTVPSGLSDFIETDDGLVLINSRAKTLIEAVAPGKAWYFDMPGAADYRVLFPKHRFVPPPDTKSYSPLANAKPPDVFQIRKRRCGHCKRPGEVTWKASWFYVPKPVALAIVIFDGIRRERSRILISDELRGQFKAAKVTGWRANPTAAEPQQPNSSTKRGIAQQPKAIPTKRRGRKK